MQIDYPYCNHHGGKMVFGPDGYLYIGVGDGGWEGDVISSRQDLYTWFGKMLRTALNSSKSNRPYTIPLDNPFIYSLHHYKTVGLLDFKLAKSSPTGKA